MSDQIVTRFAPSPTGFLHIGGGRSALFNWLYSKHKNGKMLLRIEDTDLKRNTPENVQAIYDGMRWLGLEWDGDAVSQNGNIERHKEVVAKMVEDGHAYPCYCSKERLTEMRENAMKEGGVIKYDGTCRNLDPKDAPKDIEPTIRFKAPLEGETIINDEIMGEIKIDNQQLDDLIMLRSDGTPTYMLSVVVDDHDMGVTHIVRGDDHLTNAVRQKVMYEAIGWDVPKMAHMPLILGPDGAKLSKRHGAMGIMAYRDMGYLAEAMRNYLAKLGWSHGDDEIMSTEQLIEWFDIKDIGKSPARFDFVKFEAINAHYIKTMDDAELLATLISFLKDTNHADAALYEDAAAQDKIMAAMPILKDRVKTLVELNAAFSWVNHSSPFEFDDKSAKQINDETKAIISKLRDEFAALEDWNKDNIGQCIKDFAKSQELKMGKVGQPLRVYLAGTTDAPGIFDIANIIGKEETLKRIDAVIA